MAASALCQSSAASATSGRAQINATNAASHPRAKGDFLRTVLRSIPKGFRLKAQGCLPSVGFAEEGEATLGTAGQRTPTPTANGVAALPNSGSVWPQIRFIFPMHAQIVTLVPSSQRQPHNPLLQLSAPTREITQQPVQFFQPLKHRFS